MWVSKTVSTLFSRKKLFVSAVETVSFCRGNKQFLLSKQVRNCLSFSKLDAKIPYFDQYPYTNMTLDVMMSADNVMC